MVNLFEGQPHGKVELTFSLGSGVAASPNRLDLDECALQQNLQATQQANGSATDADLQCIDSEAETAEGKIAVRFQNFSVEMETGTGKTYVSYVYLRTALELLRHYGWRKFMIVVPSVAVREGLVKTLQITGRHYLEMFANTPYKFASYDSENLSQVRQFATSASAEFMVMTIDSFTEASNVMRQTTDRLQGETPIHLAQATRPILILDKPQNMESELRVKALAALNCRRGSPFARPLTNTIPIEQSSWSNTTFTRQTKSSVALSRPRNKGHWLARLTRFDARQRTAQSGLRQTAFQSPAESELQAGARVERRVALMGHQKALHHPGRS